MSVEFTALDFNELGARASTAFFEKGVSLNKAASDIAKQFSLRSNEINRLVEKANTITQLRILKTAEDKTIEFDLADPAEVKALTYSEVSNDKTNTLEKAASIIKHINYTSEIPNFVEKARVTQLSAKNTSYLEKAAADLDKSDNLNRNAHKYTWKDFYTTKNKIDDARFHKMAAATKADYYLDAIEREFNSTYSDSFEKNAMQAYNLYGEKVFPMLEAVAINIKKPLSPDFKKEAFEDTRIDDTTPFMAKVAEYIDAQDTLILNSNAEQLYKDKLKEISTYLKTSF